MEHVRWDPTCVRPSGLIAASRIDRTGRSGPTRGQARGSRWEQVAPGLYVPAARPACVEQHILEQSSRLAAGGAVTAWAALRWRGAGFFDGCGPSGTDELPVPLLLGGGSIRPWQGSTISKAAISPSERHVLAGVPVASVQRSLFDEVVRRGSLWAAVQAIDMAAAARLISVWRFATYVGDQNSRTGAPLAREACSLAIDESRSPRETWLRLVWVLVAGLLEPLCNQPVYDLDGQLLGVPDIFDPEAGVAGEYDGAHHKDRDRHRADVSREEQFRDHGLEYFAVVGGDSRDVAARRMHRARSRAKFLPPESCAWTLERPPWDPEPETLDAYFDRLRMVHELTRG